MHGIQKTDDQLLHCLEGCQALGLPADFCDAECTSRGMWRVFVLLGAISQRRDAGGVRSDLCGEPDGDPRVWTPASPRGDSRAVRISVRETEEPPVDQSEAHANALRNAFWMEARKEIVRSFARR